MYTPSVKTAQSDPFADIQRLVTGDMQALNQLIQRRMNSDVALINQLGFYIINSGGKRLRPVLVFLTAGAFDYTGKDHIQLGCIVEFIHTATLLHDDVVDASETRRGQDSANAIWGNEASVLVGDFLYSRAFEMMVEVGDMHVMKILAEATNTIAEGEVMQLLNRNEPDTSEEQYLQVIQCKTAKLFEAAAQLGAVVCKQDFAIESAMAKYGMHLGTAFQLIDDVLDYQGSEAEIGKNVGDDLAEGKPTLPLIYIMQHGNRQEKKLVREAITNGGRQYIDPIMNAVENTGAMQYTEKLAQREAELAAEYLHSVPEGPYKDALLTLAEFSVNRSF